VIVHPPVPILLHESVRHVVDPGLPKKGDEVLIGHALVEALAVDREPSLVGGIELLPKFLEFEVAGDPDVHAELLLGLEGIEQVFGRTQGLAQVPGLQGADNVARDAGDLQAGLVAAQGGIGALVDQNGAVLEAVAFLVEAVASMAFCVARGSSAHDRIPTKSVNDLCKKLTGMSGSIKRLYMVCECKKGTWILSKSLFFLK
jgi:hypothetical protein